MDGEDGPPIGNPGEAGYVWQELAERLPECPGILVKGEGADGGKVEAGKVRLEKRVALFTQHRGQDEGDHDILSEALLEVAAKVPCEPTSPMEFSLKVDVLSEWSEECSGELAGGACEIRVPDGPGVGILIQEPAKHADVRLRLSGKVRECDVEMSDEIAGKSVRGGRWDSRDQWRVGVGDGRASQAWWTGGTVRERGRGCRGGRALGRG